jgi:hypothetical protein
LFLSRLLRRKTKSRLPQFHGIATAVKPRFRPAPMRGSNFPSPRGNVCCQRVAFRNKMFFSFDHLPVPMKRTHQSAARCTNALSFCFYAVFRDRYLSSTGNRPLELLPLVRTSSSCEGTKSGVHFPGIVSFFSAARSIRFLRNKCLAQNWAVEPLVAIFSQCPLSYFRAIRENRSRHGRCLRKATVAAQAERFVRLLVRGGESNAIR